MSTVETAIDRIRKVHAEVGSAEFSRMSGVPYTTLKDCADRRFVGPSIETLKKLASAAEAHDLGALPPEPTTPAQDAA